MSILELMFLETSALTGENVEEAFVQCARKILNKIESGKRLSINTLFLAYYYSLAQQCHFLIFPAVMWSKSILSTPANLKLYSWV